MRSVKPDRKFGLFNLTRGDRLGGTLTELSIQNPLIAAAATALVALVVPISAALEGNFDNPGLALDLLHDYGWWNQFVLGFPVLIYIAGSYFGAFPRTLRQLTETGVIRAEEPEWREVRQFAKQRLLSLLYNGLPYACGIGASMLTMPFILTPNTWYFFTEYKAGWFIPAQVFLLYYFMAYLALRLAFVFFILQKLFAFNVNIQPFHEDECGGLRSLADLSSNLNAGMFVFGIIASIGIYSNTSNYDVPPLSGYNLTILIAYIVLTSVAFFLPLYATSRYMRDAKQKVANALRERYALFDQATKSRSSGAALTSAETAENLLALQSLRNKVRSMQVWPFHVSALISYSIAIATPFVWIVALQLMSN